MSAQKERDIFRDSWVRYLGYSNEVGEAFRPVLPPRIVAYSYAVAFGYVFADTSHKTANMMKKDGRPKSVAIAAGDAILWQTFASVLIPGFTINRISAFTGRSLKALKVPRVMASTLTVCVGVASIPVIVSPIDHFVTVVMDVTYRRWFKP